jgi:hypothetical protein
MECPFLSTDEEEIECFKKCALYNYKGNGGICPFSNISHINTKTYEEDDSSSFEKETGYLKNFYSQKEEQYL